ncbi:MAG TPA: hypothetical protein VFV94_13520 [Polyangiaceae bacterium]|nr:hypothetical protein [Polyangiaceae bacterium]
MVTGRAWRHGVARAGLFVASATLGGCYDVRTIDPGHPMVPLIADKTTGTVKARSNALGLAGDWRSFGDQYPVLPRCTDTGLHEADMGAHLDGQCSFVGSPVPPRMPGPPGTGSFPNFGNRLCTYGNVARVVACTPAAKELWCADDPLDYGNMWGAGIGFDFNPDNLDPASGDAESCEPGGWDAPAHGVIGIAFDFEWNDPTHEPEPMVRVEFPVALPSEGLTLEDPTVTSEGVKLAGEPLDCGSPSEQHPAGSPFADAPAVWGTSGVANDPTHVVVGHNEILWSDVKGAPRKVAAADPTAYAYPFHPENLRGIQFHVPSKKDYRIPYSFCVSNLAFLRQ